MFFFLIRLLSPNASSNTCNLQRIQVEQMTKQAQWVLPPKIIQLQETSARMVRSGTVFVARSTGNEVPSYRGT